MGRVLGALWAEMGHDVFFGARALDKARDAVEVCAGVGASARAGTNQQAAAFGEIIYFNPRDIAVAEVLADLEVLDGKIVIESHNGPMPRPFELIAVARSRSEVLQDQIPRARVVKAFNTIAQEVFNACPREIVPFQIATFLASNERTALDCVSELARQMGLVPVDCGDLRSARQLEVLGDFVRSLIALRKDLLTTLSTPSAPPAKPKLGPRSPSTLP